MHIAIVGAGIVGIQTAHALLDDGHAVTLIDPDGLGQRTSRGNAGGIVHTDILPLASPKMWREIPRWLVDPLGPFAIRPTYMLSILPWLFRFVRASTPAQVERSTQALIGLNGSSLAAWERRLRKLGLEQKHLRRLGYACIFAEQRQFDAALPALKRQEKLGYELELLSDHAAVKRLEPALGPAAVAGVNYPAGVSVDDPASVTMALGEEAIARGARLVRDHVLSVRPTATGVETGLSSGQTIASDVAVIAAGAWSRPLCKLFGDEVPLDTERGYNLTLPKGSLGLSRMILFEGQGFVITPLDIGDRIGGAVEFGGLSLPPNYKRVDAMLGRAKRFLPDARFEGGTRWMGFRPSLPDTLPVISPASKSDRIIYAFGHAHHGLTQSAITGEIVGALVGRRSPPLDIEPFDVRRFRTR
jgi:D-amino-acid dehydrogenase